jgi:hypothetical protein
MQQAVYLISEQKLAMDFLALFERTIEKSDVGERHFSEGLRRLHLLGLT